MKILLLEDDHILCESLTEYLELEGHSVDRAHRGEEVFDLTFDHNYDLYILDINVPDINGFDVLKELKESGDETPAIYITALTDTSSISKGFSMGAEDYIKKPFDPEELVIRIKNHYLKKDKKIVYENLTYDPNTRLLQKDGKTVGLGEIQMKLFHTLITRTDKIVNSYELMELLEQPNANALRVNLAKLKNKLGIEIKNIRGQGYMIEKI
ncbi:MAG: regulator [Epsilonproteobacteria bacterium (ex Lamellibrachia satsuma)]|nr:MAG: regulator [Epsilonproteobacteria bacterium (ex Lamellibrachia satsuma)]